MSLFKEAIFPLEYEIKIGYKTAMNMKKFNQYFGGQYMKYWYVAFVIVMGWFILTSFNNASVNRYVLIAYDPAGNVIDTMEVTQSTMSQPESLPITKAYTPLKPIKFLK